MVSRYTERLSDKIEKIASDERLRCDMEILPSNYSFEIPKTIWKILSTNSKRVALQFPEGLIMYSGLISDILEKHTGCTTIIMGDVTYGACCVDDYTAKSLGCDLLVHYGHSCLVPIQNTEGIAMLYIFVSISINITHFVDCIRSNFSAPCKIGLVSTIQFVNSLQAVRNALQDSGLEILLPQCKPLSPGEILGCTSPRLDNSCDIVIYLGDGRFHLESLMIHNPNVIAYQYDPYSRRFTRERYDFDILMKNRKEAIDIARKSTTFGIIQGTLGRQGNIKIVEELERKLKDKKKIFIRVLLSEIFPKKLENFDEIDCWVQVACPRLSIDWGVEFQKPLLSPFELAVALDQVMLPSSYYPMDYYSNDSLGPWTNNHESHRPLRTIRRPKLIVTE
ncbi:diphthamide biosynthesis protein 2 domain protein [Dictyocaulus viviparus]|uniref:2-(3-amino-3-carboxypropyl)histidine synthase subunit 1 n=1 Tax=Dictyocaulus viviparus TaxID=29172 RepID=A0A0D8YA70_DICVI|nr:diphthamide biosynthesis protein 2 domain protein [Dictyocaulus viviparus]